MSAAACNQLLSTEGPGGSSPRVEARLRAAGIVIGLAVLAIFFSNNVLGSINFAANEWTFPHFVPTMQPPGSDFYWGIYRPAELLRHGHSPYEIFNCYPPFVSVFGLPYTLLSAHAAYIVHLVLLVLANVAVVRLSVVLAKRAFHSVGDPVSHASFVTYLVLTLTFMQFTSYGFLLSLERGNIDIFVTLLSLAVLWLVIHRPRTLWTQVVLLSIAVHLKVYPAILFVLLFRRHRFRCVLPALLCNVGLTLIIGWKWLPQAYAGFKIATNFDVYMVLNHSVNSFAATVLNPTWHISRRIGLALVGLPVLLWAAGALVLWRRPFSARNAVLLFALSVPVMQLVTNISYDYKLVLTVAPLAMLLYACVIRFATDGSLLAALTGCILLVLAGVISRSYIVTELPWIANKCPSVFVFQLLVLAAILVPSVTPLPLGAYDAPARPLP